MASSFAGYVHGVRPILTLTVNPSVDLAFEVASLRASGKTSARTRGVTAGGGGLNVARAIVELGGEALAVHTAGGASGRRLDEALDGEGLTHVSLETPADTRESVVVFESDHDRSYHVVPRGRAMPNDVGERLLDEVADRMHDHDLLVASGSLPEGMSVDFYAQLCAVVHREGGKLALDTSGRALVAALEAGVDIVKPNRSEASALAGSEIHDFRDARAINARLLADGAASLVATTLGALGTVVSSGETHIELRAPPLPRPAISEAGAGDSFMAGLVLPLAGGASPAEAGRLAVAAAAGAVMRAGAGLCRRDDVDALLDLVEVATR